PRTLWLDAFTLSEAPVPARHPVRMTGGRKEIVFDDFDDDVVRWVISTRADAAIAKVGDRGVLGARYLQSREQEGKFEKCDLVESRYLGLEAVKLVARATRYTVLRPQLREFIGTNSRPRKAAT